MGTVLAVGIWGKRCSRPASQHFSGSHEASDEHCADEQERSGQVQGERRLDGPSQAGAIFADIADRAYRDSQLRQQK